jgi:hypothetical protein
VSGVCRKRRYTMRREKRKPTAMDVAQKSACSTSHTAGSDGFAGSGAASGDPAAGARLGHRSNSWSFMPPDHRTVGRSKRSDEISLAPRKASTSMFSHSSAQVVRWGVGDISVPPFCALLLLD